MVCIRLSLGDFASISGVSPELVRRWAARPPPLAAGEFPTIRNVVVHCGTVQTIARAAPCSRRAGGLARVLLLAGGLLDRGEPGRVTQLMADGLGYSLHLERQTVHPAIVHILCGGGDT